ncbi:MAG: sulfotransferase, partial [Ilumatobacteraceae bacterium]
RYRRVLQVLDEGDGRRWVVKAPAHTAELPHVASAFPGAIVVQLHRDIVETIASGSSLFAVFRSMYSDQVDGAGVGRYQTDTTELWLRRAKTFRDDPASRAVTFVDLDYPRLVHDPVGSISEIYAAAGMEPPPDPTEFVERYLAAFPRHAHGPHAYTATDFGLDDAAIRERFAGL